MNTLIVTTYSGHTYAERPKSFQWEGKEYEVTDIDKAWLEPGQRCFRVRTGDNKNFQLCYNERQQRWLLIALAGGEA